MTLKFSLKQIDNGWLLEFYDGILDCEEFYGSFEKAEKRMVELQRGKR